MGRGGGVVIGIAKRSQAELHHRWIQAQTMESGHSSPPWICLYRSLFVLGRRWTSISWPSKQKPEKMAGSSNGAEFAFRSNPWGSEWGWTLQLLPEAADSDELRLEKAPKGKLGAFTTRRQNNAEDEINPYHRIHASIAVGERTTEWTAGG